MKIKNNKTCEIWAGTGSFSKVAKDLGFDTWTTDNNPKFNCDLIGDVLDHEIQKEC